MKPSSETTRSNACRMLSVLILFVIVLVSVISLADFSVEKLPAEEETNPSGCEVNYQLQEDGLWHNTAESVNDTARLCQSAQPSRGWWRGLFNPIEGREAFEKPTYSPFPETNDFPTTSSFFGDELYLKEGSDLGISEVDPSAGLNPRKFRLKDPLTVAFSRLVNEKLDHWLPIKGVKKGIGHRGMVKSCMFPGMANNSHLAPCVVQIRITEGTLYFRYGSILDDSQKLLRANLALKMMEDAIKSYNLIDLKAELFLNVCEHPQSFDNSLSPGRSGFPVFSSHWTGGAVDIPFPDPMDLVQGSQRVPAVPWDQMYQKAVFRGPSTQFDMKAMNHGGNPRYRLHMFSRARPDLLDAGLTAWGPNDNASMKTTLKREGFQLATEISPEKLASFKYFVVPDFKAGTLGMCDALSRGQVAVRSWSAFSQFFDPMVLPGVHYVQVDRMFNHLFEIIEWMRSRDTEMQAMVARANQVSQMVCTWKSRVLYWAILLSKYSHLALEEPTAVEKPKNVCKGEAITVPVLGVEKNPKLKPKCKNPNVACGDFCIEGLKPQQWTWLSLEALSKVQRVDPFVRL